MYSLKRTIIDGCYEIQPKISTDLRGKFIKVFHHKEFKYYGLETSFEEEFYSQSFRGVIRGMHFQNPPSDQVKVIYCVYGEVYDVVLDLRKGSPTYLQSIAIMLSSRMGNIIYLPKGVAHGFCAVSEIATLVYKVSTAYDPQADTGILWNSIGIDWPTSKPILSERDCTFEPLSKFRSPFTYGK